MDQYVLPVCCGVNIGLNAEIIPVARRHEGGTGVFALKTAQAPVCNQLGMGAARYTNGIHVKDLPL